MWRTTAAGFPQEDALANIIDCPRNVIMREDVMVGHLDAWLASAFDPLNRRPCTVGKRLVSKV
ncbi:hypothetical protein [Dactylosporangium sp. NPDC051484]|uniref:hypothetical protein n=1 Tax=Dactylosporangium sp. NPDC051484 TaxID=3154942 RepID=UPI00344CEA65